MTRGCRTQLRLRAKQNQFAVPYATTPASCGVSSYTNEQNVAGHHHFVTINHLGTAFRRKAFSIGETSSRAISDD